MKRILVKVGIKKMNKLGLSRRNLKRKLVKVGIKKIDKLGDGKREMYRQVNIQIDVWMIKILKHATNEEKINKTKKQKE